MTKQGKGLPGPASNLNAICLRNKALAASTANAAARSSQNKKNKKKRRSKNGRGRMKLHTQHGAPGRSYGNKPKKVSPNEELHGEEAPAKRTQVGSTWPRLLPTGCGCCRLAAAGCCRLAVAAADWPWLLSTGCGCCRLAAAAADWPWLLPTGCCRLWPWLLPTGRGCC
jgi:hypothetical protein